MAFLLNEISENLAPYPMEELKRIQTRLRGQNVEIFDFGTGDPRIPVWQQIIDDMKKNTIALSQYPSILGIPELQQAQENYLKRRFGLTKTNKWMTLPSRGSKEAIFHIAMALIGRNGKNSLLFPNPGYPVYLSSVQFAKGRPLPYELTEKNNYLLEPWTLPKSQSQDVAAVWINYPHNPTGAICDEKYLAKLIEWCRDNDCILLSDECYCDIYTEGKDAVIPPSPLSISQEGVLSFYSLSKRSGLTGYRSGFMAGDATILEKHQKARANFGLAMPVTTQWGSITAWNDDEHVKERRQIFTHRLKMVGEFLMARGLLAQIPKATFYVWIKIPKAFGEDDVKFCLDLSEKGIISTPSSWLGDKYRGYFRLALVPEDSDIKKALNILDQFLASKK